MSTSPPISPGEFDPSFGPLHDGKLLLVYSDYVVNNGQLISEAPDGKIYVGGTSWARGSTLPEHFSLTRVLSDGTLDSEFGIAGTAHLKLTAPDVSLGRTPIQLFYITHDGEEKILLSMGQHSMGEGASTITEALIRLTDKGELDKSFGTDGLLLITPPFKVESTQQPASDIMYDGSIASGRTVHASDGRIYIISAAIDPDLGLGVGVVMCFDYNGVADLTFNNTGYASLAEVLGVRSSLNDIVVQDGKITVCGWATSGALLARLNLDGSFDKTFSGVGYKLLAGTSFQFTSLAVLPDGRTVATGFGFPERKGLVAAYTPTGLIDRSFNQGAPIYENFDDAVAVLFLGMGYKDDKIVVSGRYIVGQTPYFVTARYLVNGRRDTNFGNGKGWVVHELGSRALAHGMTLQSDGKILVIGNDHDGFYGHTVIVTRLQNGA
ncbi:delta-60 repeat domain-containing protein [Pseudomonas sp. MAG733B]|uniref:delta-60 repeat domain-containing protein n=1 Tax=Pseudomonas sp. MAG733B TaxID=3122079 RepID=UPI0030D1CFCA